MNGISIDRSKSPVDASRIDMGHERGAIMSILRGPSLAAVITITDLPTEHKKFGESCFFLNKMKENPYFFNLIVIKLLLINYLQIEAVDISGPRTDVHIFPLRCH